MRRQLSLSSTCCDFEHGEVPHSLPFSLGAAGSRLSLGSCPATPRKHPPKSSEKPHIWKAQTLKCQYSGGPLPRVLIQGTLPEGAWGEEPRKVKVGEQVSAPGFSVRCRRGEGDLQAVSRP